MYELTMSPIFSKHKNTSLFLLWKNERKKKKIWKDSANTKISEDAIDLLKIPGSQWLTHKCSAFHKVIYFRISALVISGHSGFLKMNSFVRVPIAFHNLSRIDFVFTNLVILMLFTILNLLGSRSRFLVGIFDKWKSCSIFKIFLKFHESNWKCCVEEFFVLNICNVIYKSE